MSKIRFEPGNFALHFFVPVAMILAVWAYHWYFVLDVAIFAFLREQAQHRYILTRIPDERGGGHFVEKRTFFDLGWLGWQQVFEIGQWTLGAIAACTLWHFFG
jgi:hypothetical protein